MNAELQSGIQIVLRETELEEKVKDADYVITGEGVGWADCDGKSADRSCGDC